MIEKGIKMADQKKPNIKRNEYENLYDCIRTDQVPPDQIAYWFTDKKFFEWYKNQRDKKASWE